MWSRVQPVPLRTAFPRLGWTQAAATLVARQSSTEAGAPACAIIPRDVLGTWLDAVLWRGGPICKGKVLKSLKTLPGCGGGGCSAVLMQWRQLAKPDTGVPFPGWAGRQDQTPLPPREAPSYAVPFPKPEKAPSSLESCLGASANSNTHVRVGGPFSAEQICRKAVGSQQSLDGRPSQASFLAPAAL